MLSPHERIIVALDFSSPDEARALARELAGRVGVFKLGMELVYSGGLELARELAQAGEKVFLDLKLLDIGHTVMKATRAAARTGASFLTVHAMDEKTMLAAVEGREGSDLKLLGVTVMTNLDQHDLGQQGIIGQTPAQLALHRAQMAAHCGFDGVVSSGHEAAAIREIIGSDRLIVTPGIRMPGARSGDQERIMTPAQAVGEGADYLVIGRPIIAAEDPLRALEQITAALAS
jgi:orotidine-5'-phosphate decarboxylase